MNSLPIVEQLDIIKDLRPCLIPEEQKFYSGVIPFCSIASLSPLAPAPARSESAPKMTELYLMTKYIHGRVIPSDIAGAITARIGKRALDAVTIVRQASTVMPVMRAFFTATLACRTPATAVSTSEVTSAKRSSWDL